MVTDKPINRAREYAKEARDLCSNNESHHERDHFPCLECIEITMKDVIRRIVDQACRDICSECAQGTESVYGAGRWSHRQGLRCDAWAIRGTWFAS